MHTQASLSSVDHWPTWGLWIFHHNPVDHMQKCLPWNCRKTCSSQAEGRLHYHICRSANMHNDRLIALVYYNVSHHTRRKTTTAPFHTSKGKQTCTCKPTSLSAEPYARFFWIKVWKAPNPFITNPPPVFFLYSVFTYCYCTALVENASQFPRVQ